MTLTVAIASESDYDGEIYRHLASSILNCQVVRWTGPYAFTGCRAVAKLVPAFLGAASTQGIRHAIVAVDNDGGGKTRLEHDADHVAPAFNLDDDDGCRECWLSQALPASWSSSRAKACVAVPVQTIETWLLTIRATPPFTTATPEHQYSRLTLKKRFFGKGPHSLASRMALAMAELQKPTAMATLAQRPSFVRFADGLTSWP